MGKFNAEKIDIDAKMITSLFIDDGERISDVCSGILEEAKGSHTLHHDLEPDHKCLGGGYYIRVAMKYYFSDHPELTEMERLAIVANLFYNIGSSDAKERILIKKLMEYFGISQEELDEIEKKNK